MRDAHGTLSISLRRRQAITAGLLLGMTLGALEATVVSTAMPTVISTLGGLAHYSWVFSAYLLTSTAIVLTGWAVLLTLPWTLIARSRGGEAVDPAAAAG